MKDSSLIVYRRSMMQLISNMIGMYRPRRNESHMPFIMLLAHPALLLLILIMVMGLTLSGLASLKDPHE
jgi:hypothetical protein